MVLGIVEVVGDGSEITVVVVFVAAVLGVVLVVVVFSTVVVVWVISSWSDSICSWSSSNLSESAESEPPPHAEISKAKTKARKIFLIKVVLMFLVSIHMITDLEV